METLHIVISWNCCGHADSEYIELKYSGNTSDIDQYVADFYGKESGQRWRVATPADKEAHEFSSATAIR